MIQIAYKGHSLVKKDKQLYLDTVQINGYEQIFIDFEGKITSSFLDKN